MEWLGENFPEVERRKILYQWPDYVLCEAGGWELKMSKYFDKSLLLGGNGVMLLMEDIVTSLGESQVQI